MQIDRVTRVDDLVEVRNVVVSVANKAGLEEFAPALVESCSGIRFYATGGTHAFLSEVIGERAAQKVVDITRYSTRPVTHSGLARTTDFKMYLGLLADPWNEVHVNDVSAAGAVFFDLVISNMHPFPDVRSDNGLDPEVVRGLIDIGGPGLVRAAVRNYVRVAVVPDPEEYSYVAERITALGGKTDLALRLDLAQKAFTSAAHNAEHVAEFFKSLTPESIRAAYNIED